MFAYTDPIGRGVLATQNALGTYRDLLQGFYEFGAEKPGTRFCLLGNLPTTAKQTTIPWPAFPKTADADDKAIDARRFDFQDEYVEWHIERLRNQIRRITFITELPEYYEALAKVGHGALVAGIVDAIPSASPTPAELYGLDFDPDVATPRERAARFRGRVVVPFDAPAGTVPENPWTNGSKGILCLGQKFNTMGALFNLVRECAFPRSGSSTDTCAAVGGACGPRRNSDPVICTQAQEVCRIPQGLSLSDPAGIRILELAGAWRIDGVEVDINDPDSNQGAWVIDRNGRRGVLDTSRALTLNNDSISSGAQVSRVLQVAADVVSADLAELLDREITVTADRPSRGVII